MTYFVTNILPKHPILRNADFVSLLLGQTISRLGDAVFNIALLWIILSQFESARVMSMFLFLLQTSFMITFVFSGVIIDKFNRRNIMIVADLVRGIIVLAYAVNIGTQAIETQQIYMLAIVDGIFTAIFSAAHTAIIPEIAGDKDLPNALSLNSASDSITSIIGPVLGGMMISVSWIGVSGVLVFNAVSFFAAAASLTLMKGNCQSKVAIREKKEAVFYAVANGAKYLYGNALLLLLAGFSGLLKFFAAPIFVLLPLFAKDVLNVTPSELGLLDSFISIGGLVATIVIGILAGKYRNGKYMLVFYILHGLLLILLSLSTNLSEVLIVSFLYGVTGLVSSVLFTAHLQTRIENRFRGRANSLLYVVSDGSLPLAILAAGFLATRFGTTMAMYLCGICFTLIAFGGIFIRRIRELE